MVRISHPYMTTGKTTALTIQIFVSKVMSLLFNVLSRFVISSVGKESICNAGDPSLIPGSGRSAGEGKGYPLQYSGLENSMDYVVHGFLQAKILEWVAFPFFRGSSQPRN